MRSKYLSKRRREVDGRVEKFCRGCSRWVPLEQLAKASTCQDGRAPRCRTCEQIAWDIRAAKREERGAA